MSGMGWEVPTGLTGNSPDDCGAEVNICAFPTLPQDRRELRTATDTWVSRMVVEG